MRSLSEVVLEHMEYNVFEAKSISTVQEYIDEIKSIYAKYLPKSFCDARLRKMIGDNTLYIYCYLESEDKMAGLYVQNDMFSITFNSFINVEDSNSAISDDMILENQSKSYKIKHENPHMAFDSRKLSFRKTKGVAKSLKAFDNFMKKLVKSLDEDYKNGNIHKNHTEVFERNFVNK